MVPGDVTHNDLTRQYDLLRSDPEKFLEIAQQFVAQNPDDPTGYFTRHRAWTHLGQMELALADLDRSLALEKHYTTYEARGNLLRRMGRYLEAVADFNTSETLDRETWLGGFGPLFRAECHARLGNLDAALADCATLPDDHWTPGIHEAPAGNKRDVTTRIRWLAAAALQASQKHPPP
jgi:tetratricopeptide (TPR) repeat protein